MCGIVGFVSDTGDVDRQQVVATVGRMADSLAHRGPDDRGCWADGSGRVALGHRRLSILDLSSGGHQPMLSVDGRWVISFNGEFYNFSEIRRRLEEAGVHFRSHSDTEVFLELVAREGPAAALASVRGMFALALWDNRDQTLYLARDRLGEKPLYYGRVGQSFVFASELRALCVHPEWRGVVDRRALASYLRYNCVPAPQSIFENISKLLPGHLLSYSRGGEVRTIPFWDAGSEFVAAQANPWPDKPKALLDDLSSLLEAVVADQMVADVPVGAFLSGGVDSSLVVALMQSISSRPVQTFTIGFGAKDFNEATYAREVARILGTEHVEHYMTGDEALGRVPSLAECYDEPFADSSQLPTMMVSELARRHVTVSLSGDGGDELFGGYTRYPESLAAWRKLNRLPLGLRRTGATLLDTLPDSALHLAGRVARTRRATKVPDAWLAGRVRDKARRWAAADFPAAYRRAMSFWDRPEEVVIGAEESFPRESELAGMSAARSAPISWTRFRDAMIYLPDDILVKVDRAAMRVSLETRVPLLDHRVVELAWRVPDSVCFHDGRGKWPLRALLARHLPDELINRPKMGFAVPLNEWLRGPLREWAEELLDADRLRREGWFRPEPIRRRWKDLLSGGDTHELPLWSILMFQAWQEHWGEAISG